MAVFNCLLSDNSRISTINNEVHEMFSETHPLRKAVKELIYVEKAFTNKHNLAKSLFYDSDTGDSESSFLNKVFGGKIPEKLSEPQEDYLRQSIHNRIRNLAQASLDPIEAKTLSTLSSDFLSVLSMESMKAKRLGKIDDFISKIPFLHSFYSTMFVDRHREFEKFAPIRKGYIKLSILKNEISRMKSIIMGEFDKMIGDWGDKYKKFGITEDMINDILPDFDGLNNYTAKDKLNIIKGKLSDDYNIRNEEDQRLIIGKFQDMKKDWEMHNYGNGGDYKNVRPNSFVDRINTVMKAYADLYSSRVENSVEGKMAIRQIETDYSSSQIITRKDYVPGGTEDIKVFETKDTINYMPSMVTMFKQRDSQDINSRVSFSETFNNNILNLSIKMTSLGQMTFAGLVDGATSKREYQSWLAMNPVPTRVFKHFSEKMWEHITMERPKISPVVESIKMAWQNIIGITASSILLNPASGVYNLAGGYIGLDAVFGSGKKFITDKGRTTVFNQAVEHGDLLAQAVHEVSLNKLLETSKQVDFIAKQTIKGSDSTNILMQAQRGARDLILKGSDISTGRGLLGILSMNDTLGFLSLKNTEETLRKTVIPILFQQADVARLATGTKFNSKEEAIKFVNTFIDSAEGMNVIYGMKKALGDFDEENKPFWSWMLLQDADTISKTMIGGAASMWYLFKHVGVNVARLAKDMAISFPYIKQNEISKGTQQTVGLGALGVTLGVTLVEIINALVSPDAEDRAIVPIVGSMLKTVNPLQETMTVLKGTVGFLKMNSDLLSDAPITEERAKSMMDELLSLSGGVLMGGTLVNLDNYITEKYSDKDTVSKMNTVSSQVNGRFSAFVQSFMTSDYLEKRELYKYALDNKTPLGAMTSSSNDWLTTIGYINKFVLTPIQKKIKGEGWTSDFGKNDYVNDAKSVQTRYFYDMKNMLSTLSGLNIYRSEAFWEGYNPNGYTDYNSVTNRAKRALARNPNLIQRDVASQLIYQLTQYNKMYIDSAIKNSLKANAEYAAKMREFSNDR